MTVEVEEVAGILATLARAGVTVRVKAGRLVVLGATLDFIPAIETLTGREKAVEKALATMAANSEYVQTSTVGGTA
jgi:hypothetical protein